jgi:hypothetical protein
MGKGGSAVSSLPDPGTATSPNAAAHQGGVHDKKGQSGAFPLPFEYPQNSYTDTAHSAEAAGFYRIDVRLKPLPEPLFEVASSTWVDAISQPGPNDIWQYGTSKSVIWNNGLLQGSMVSIYVLHDAPAGLVDTNPDPMSVQPKIWFRFATNVPNSGSYTTDPAMLNGNGNAYKILVVSDKNYWDMSQGLFILQP